jgi:hypothetical protein
MLKNFRVNQQPEQIVSEVKAPSLSLFERDAALPFTIRQPNNPPENVKPWVSRGLSIDRTDDGTPAERL